MVWGCDYAPTEHTHEHEHDNIYEAETEDSIIEREFVVIEVRNSASHLDIATYTTGSNCPTNNPADCAGECGGDAVEQTYYYDYDGDGLGDIDYSYIFCSANVCVLKIRKKVTTKNFTKYFTKMKFPI